MAGLSPGKIEQLNKGYSLYKTQLGTLIHEALLDAAENIEADTQGILQIHRIAAHLQGTAEPTTADAGDFLQNSMPLVAAPKDFLQESLPVDSQLDFMALAADAEAYEPANPMQWTGLVDTKTKALDELRTEVDLKALRGDLVAAADATDLATAITLLNEIKAVLNAMNA